MPAREPSTGCTVIVKPDAADALGIPTPEIAGNHPFVVRPAGQDGVAGAAPMSVTKTSFKPLLSAAMRSGALLVNAMNRPVAEIVGCTLEPNADAPLRLALM